ncbi:glycerate kinase [Cellulosimicrobium cellulans]|uniref:glycerate kinase n=1 Tax=Cellulosimicrobium cellulans TaxID=1710 RepID=UPI00195BF3C6|nr:glycerate kinase [Cellulosimicrobium cellulans]MBM7820285.1 glycerate kinase [Cellulosimicrobium cellulans]
MRVLLTGSAVPPVPDGAWPAAEAPSPPGPAGPTLDDVAGWWSPHADVETVALAVAGPAFLDAVAPVAPEVLAGVVPGPDGVDVPVAVRRRTSAGDGTGARRTVYADASQVPATGASEVLEGDAGAVTVPARSSTAAGHLLALAADAARGPDGAPGRVVLATGGSTSHDAGLGALLALAGSPTHVGDHGTTVPDDVVRAARAALGGTDLVAAVASDLPLLGLHGASATLDARHVDPAVAQHLERALGAVAHDVASAVEHAGATAGGGGALAGRGLLAASSAGRRLAGLPGTGSGGGLAHAVVALGGRLVPALRVVADDLGLDARLAGVDAVVVLADELGAHELGGGTVREVAARAAHHALPVVVVARAVVAGRREQAAAGVSGTYAWGDGDPRALVERVARTWSRG